MMTTMRGSEIADEHILVGQARRGDRAAFRSLYDVHAPATWRLALAVRPDRAAAADAVADAFARVLGPTERGAPTRTVWVHLLLLAATRDAVIAGSDSKAAPHLALVPERPPLDQPLALATDRAVHAFANLPERWRSVLWLTQVERLVDHDAGVVLGLSAANATQLTERAQAGLREQFSQDQVHAATPPDCQRTAARLGDYVSDTLSVREHNRVRRHLDGCAVCRARLDEIDDMAPRLRRSLPVLPLAVGIAAEQAWLARGSSYARGPFGLTLPGGRPLPPWAERALTGATAAVITLGITGAFLAGGRGDRDRRDEVPFASAGTDEPIRAGDGESALGGTGDTPEATNEGAAAPEDEPPTRAPSAAPKVADPTSVPTPGPSSPGGTTTPPSTPLPAPVDPGAPDPVEPPPTAPAGPPPLVIRVDDGTGISVGEDCTGVELLGIVIGCDPPTGTAPPLLGDLGLGL
jgi:DNA-directed RNA polymerase specialized sigma24 family protein